MAPRTLTSAQRLQVRRAIRDGHLAFLAEVFGPDAIGRDDYDRLRASGKIRDERLLPQDAASAAYAIGGLAGDAQSVGVLSDPDQFWQQVGDDLQVVTEAEREAVAIARDRIGEHVRALGARLEEAAGHAMVDADDASRRRRLTGTTGGPRPTDEVVTRIRKAAAGLRRDWFRVAHTEIHNMAEEAKSVALAHRDPGRDPRVYKRPHPDACAFCRMLYLKPDGVTPRVFALSALLANGSNVGRRAGRPTRSGKGRTEWKAVLGAAHPFCQCPLHHLPDGVAFDVRGRLVRVGFTKSDSIEVERVRDGTDHVCER